MTATPYPSGRSGYTPGRARMGEPTPQTDPDRFSSEDLRAEFRYLSSLDRRYGANAIRARARVALAAEIARRADGRHMHDAAARTRATGGDW